MRVAVLCCATPSEPLYPWELRLHAQLSHLLVPPNSPQPPVPPPPLQSETALEDLDQYPEEPEVHKYLHKRLMAFDLSTLYELHYLMITLGKASHGECRQREGEWEGCS